MPGNLRPRVAAEGDARDVEERGLDRRGDGPRYEYGLARVGCDVLCLCVCVNLV